MFALVYIRLMRIAAVMHIGRAKVTQQVFRTFYSMIQHSEIDRMSGKLGTEEERPSQLTEPEDYLTYFSKIILFFQRFRDLRELFANCPSCFV